MDRESDTALATMAGSMRISDTSGHPHSTNQEEDCFYDCEESFHEDDTSQDKRTESVNVDQEVEEGMNKDLETARLKTADEQMDKPDTNDVSKEHSQSCEEKTTDRKDDTLGEHGRLGDGQSAEDQKWEEEFIEEDENKMDSDSELKEEVVTEAAEFDDEYLQELEKDLTEEEKESRKAESMALKETGNGQFKRGEHAEAEESYTAALRICPVCYKKERSILFSNRAAARLHQDKKETAISDCSKAIELNPNYVRAILRRAELYEKTEKLDEALEDYKTVLEKDPSISLAREACVRLPPQIEERNEKLKEEMMSKLKDLGNMILRPFGLSTANFQVNQDTDTGSYSINFVQNPNNNNR
ncbi:tetratricopeptide repeat protein 1 [Chanos chanos]|uniref:Tetratricopeptide repeat protein 1 n=1 Tax=Chanos chanos TaxID=29144 RepID=A0A6J2W1K2_CHACN|nr:tetratricopeptide repeat protein 1 [Chanos chanos]